MICLFCDDPVEVSPNGATCTDCDIYAFLQDNGRWRVYLPSRMVPTSDWIECEASYCSDPDHGGSCGNCRTLGVVRGTLDHPTTLPPLETS